jgi:hypothetical protein
MTVFDICDIMPRRFFDLLLTPQKRSLEKALLNEGLAL